MGKMTVYHGSYITVKTPKIRKGKNTKDFGGMTKPSFHQL